MPVSEGISRRNLLLMVHVAWTVGLIAVGLIYRLFQVEADILVYPACVILALSFGWILAGWFSLRGTLFEPYALFMIAAGLFNGGQAVLELFGLNPNGILDGRFPPEVLIESLFFVTLSALAVHTGALLAVREKPADRSGAGENAPFRERATRMVGWFLLAISAVPVSLFLKNSVSVVLDYGYMALFQREDSYSLTWALSGFFVPGLIFLLAGSKSSRPVRGFCLAIAALYTAVNLFLGSRGAAMMSAVAVAWIYDRIGRRIPRGLIVGLSVAGLIAFSLVRETRGTDGRWRLSLDQEFETLANLQNPVSTAVSEMGYSLVTVAHTLTLVPEVRSYDLGVSYLYGASAIIPNLGWEVHPGVAHGLLCDWLTRTVEPTVAATGGGLGFSFIAEAYLNFGWAGGLVWLAIVGYLCVRLFLQADTLDPARQALVASFLSFFFVFARGESAIVVRGLVWYALVPYLLAAVLAASTRRVGVNPCN